VTLLYRATDAREAALLAQALESRGIECRQVGGQASGAFGGLGADALRVDLHVAEERAEEAKRIIEEEQARPREPARAWTCPACREPNDAGFDLCWSCQTPRPDAPPS
jgi:hypothetical protein